MVRILIAEGVRIYGQPKEVGDIVSVSDVDAQSLILSGKGTLIEPEPTLDPEPEQPTPEPPAPPVGRKTHAKPPAPKEA